MQAFTDIVVGVLTVCGVSTLVLVIRLSSFVGAKFQMVDDDHKRIEALEAIRCPHLECPLKMRPILQAAANEVLRNES
jgi:hypothetical protein